MGTFTIQCSCGEQFHATDDAIGRQLRCRRCGSSVAVARPSAPSEPPPSASKTRRRRKKRSHSSDTTGASSRPVVLIPRTGFFRVLDFLVWAYVGAVVVIALTMWTLGDRAMIGTVLLFMGRWVFLLPLAVLVPAALIWHRMLLVPLLVGALVVLGPIMGFRTGWRRLLPAPEGMAFRVVTFNSGASDRAAQLLPEMVNTLRPDVVALQECKRMLSTIVSLTPQWRPGWHHYEGAGLCLMSRYPIRETSVMDRSALDRVKQSESAEIGGAGYVVRFIIDTPAGPIRLANLHLETPRKGLEGLMDGDFRRLRLNTVIREIEAKLARAWVSQGTGPLVVLGDFNTPVESRIFQRHWGDLDDAHSVAGTGLGMTKFNGWIQARIDHVLTSDEWHVRNATVGEPTQSDHRPLIVDLVLKKD